MKPIEGFKAEAPAASYPMLPKGLYVAKINNVKIDGDEPDQRLVLRVDITEGEHTGYYVKRFNSDKERGGQYEAKYKGDFSIQIPNQNNPRRQHYDWDNRAFGNAIWAIEQSNPGYHWDWNEQGLKGKAVGINVRGGTYNGKPYTSIGRLESVQAIRDGSAKVMADAKPRGDAQTAGNMDGGAIVGTDDELPF